MERTLKTQGSIPTKFILDSNDNILFQGYIGTFPVEGDIISTIIGGCDIVRFKVIKTEAATPEHIIVRVEELTHLKQDLNPVSG